MKQKDTNAALEALLNTVTNELASGGTIQLVGFATFKIAPRQKYM